MGNHNETSSYHSSSVSENGEHEDAAAVELGPRISRTDTKELAPPSDGGWRAWSQVLGVHLAIFNTWGFINSFGFFQSYYVETLQREPSDIAWIGSFQLWLILTVGVLAGRAMDAGYFKACFISGTILLVLGLFMTSICKEYWQVFLAQGVCQGIANGLIFIPSLTIISGYFQKHRVIAICTAASGAGTGALVYAGTIQSLLPQVGFQWTIRVIAFIVLTLQTFVFFIMRPRIPPRKSGPLLDLPAFKDPLYSLSAAAFFLVNMGIWSAYDYVPSFAETVLQSDPDRASDLLLILNGSGIIGRIIPALIADRYTGPINLLIPFGFLTGILPFAWTAVNNYAGFIGWSVVYGFCSAAFLAIYPASLAVMTEDPKKMGIRIGMTFGLVGFANLLGPPISGVLIQRLNGNYLGIQIYSGLCCCLGAGILMVTRVMKVGWSINKRM